MYIPDDFAMIDRAAMIDVMQCHPLALLATNGEDGPQVTQLPLVFETDDGGRDWLCGHFARANPHWKSVCDAGVVAIFRGADGYITPSWYPTKRETGKVVPTWNYVAVEARGTLHIVEAEDEASRIVALLTDAMESRRPEPWAMQDAPARYTEAMLRGVVAFRIEVATLSGKAKLSQNKGKADFDGVRHGLAQDSANSPLLEVMGNGSVT